MDGSELQQAISGTPSGTPLLRETGIPVSEGAGGLAAATCVTVVPNASASVPATGDGICAAGSHTLTLDCQPLDDDCQGVYPVSVALVRQGSSTPVARFTTFLTYQQPNAESTTGGPLRVGVVLPVTASGLTTMADALTDNHDVPTTLAVSPWRSAPSAPPTPATARVPSTQLAALSGDEMIDQPYVPINLAALTEAGLSSEVGAQLGRGDDILRAAGLKPDSGAWVDTSSTLSAGDAANLASGLQSAGATQAVVSDSDLASAGLSNYTFAQPFTLDLGHGSTIPAAAADSSLSARFTATPDNPVLGAEQLLAGLSFVHFEDTFLRQPRGVVVVPPAKWHPSTAFMDALLGGLAPANTALKAVTLSDLFAQVPAGGNREPAVRQLQSGAASHGITSSAAGRIALDRQQLSSFSSAVDGHPPNLTTLGDTLLTTEAKGLSNGGRSSALNAYAKSFAGTTGQVTLGTERTVTFTSQRAAIPVTVLSSAPYPVTVVVTLSSDKFTFPDGNTQRLTLVHPTTSVRVTAQARTSGDHLPIEVTLPHARRPGSHRPHRADGALDRDLLRGGGPHGPRRCRAALLVGAHLATLPPRPPTGALTVATHRRAARRAAPLALRTSAAYVAVGTGVSRVTGLLRFVALAWALGQTTLADSYNLANTTPNMLYDVVLGGVLSATFIPVFVDRLANKTEREAFDSISAVLTVSVVVLLGTTVAALVAAPFLIDALTVLDTHAGAHQLHRVLLERQVATGFLRWFVIQIAAYGLFALAAALLNTRRRFVAVAWAPIVNNIVCIGILSGSGSGPATAPRWPAWRTHRSQLILLGLGTSLGVVLQGVALDPEPAQRRPRAAALELEPARRRAARRDPAGRLDVRLRPGQPDRALRRDHPRRQRGRARPGVLVHLRLRLLPAALRHRRGDRHVGRHTGPGAAVVHRAPDRVPETHDGGPPRRPGSHHPGGGRHAAPGPAGRGPAARERSQHPGRRRRPPVPRWPCSRSASPASAPTSTSCASCSRCSGPGSPSTSTWSRTRLNIVLALVLVHTLGVRGLALSLSIAYTRGGGAGARRLPPVVRAPGRPRDVGAPGPCRHRRRPHGRRSCSWSPTSRGRPASPAFWPGSSAPWWPVASPSAPS